MKLINVIKKEKKKRKVKYDNKTNRNDFSENQKQNKKTAYNTFGLVCACVQYNLRVKDHNSQVTIFFV